MNNICKRSAISFLLYRNFRHQFLNRSRHFHVVHENLNITSKLNFPISSSVIFTRCKSKKHSTKDSDDDDGEDYKDDTTLSKDSKIMKFNTTSMRTDVLLKSALGVARNKIEQVFYESKIRLNGRKILKKSISAKVGDEIDVIKSISPKNPEHIYVSRVEILNVTPNEDSITVTARRFKTLLIENYEKDPYKASVAPDEEN